VTTGREISCGQIPCYISFDSLERMLEITANYLTLRIRLPFAPDCLSRYRVHPADALAASYIAPTRRPGQSAGTRNRKRRSLHMTRSTNVNGQIARQIFIALQRRGADKLLSTIESHGETLSGAEVLSMLREYNSTGRVQRRPQ
jgi:hypothetical protein